MEVFNRAEALGRIEAQLIRIEEKLDLYQERIAKAETDINWIQGHLKIATTLLLSFLGAVTTYFINKFGN